MVRGDSMQKSIEIWEMSKDEEEVRTIFRGDVLFCRRVGKWRSNRSNDIKCFTLERIVLIVSLQFMVHVNPGDLNKKQKRGGGREGKGGETLCRGLFRAE